MSSKSGTQACAALQVPASGNELHSIFFLGQQRHHRVGSDLYIAANLCFTLWPPAA